jgi:hypothetical protein
VGPNQLGDLMTDQSGRDHGLAIPPPLIRVDVIAAMRRDAVALLPPMIADVIARTEQPLLQAITDLEAPSMAFGRVALLGDAAFVARPHSRQASRKPRLMRRPSRRNWEPAPATSLVPLRATRWSVGRLLPQAWCRLARTGRDSRSRAGDARVWRAPPRP